MKMTLSVSKKRRELVAYFILTYSISWAIEIPIALSTQGIIAVQIPLALHYLASFGPFFAALVVAIVSEGLHGVGRLFRGLGKWRVGWGYVFFAIVLPVILFAFAFIISRIMQGAWPDLGLLGKADYLPRLGILPALGLWLLTFGLGEEMGWRGFALPRLQRSRSAFSASLFLGLIWAFWHLPALFYRDTYIALGLVAFPIMIFSVTIASVILTWLFNGTQGSLLMVILFHGLFDFFSVSSAGGESSPVIMTVVLVFWAVRVVKVYGRANLAPMKKQIV